MNLRDRIGVRVGRRAGIEDGIRAANAFGTLQDMVEARDYLTACASRAGVA